MVFFNSTTPQGLAACLQLSKCMGDQCRTFFLFTVELSHREYDEAEASPTASNGRVEAAYNQHKPGNNLISRLPAKVAVWDPNKRRWDNHGAIEEQRPHRRYHVRAQSGRVLV